MEDNSIQYYKSIFSKNYEYEYDLTSNELSKDHSEDMHDLTPNSGLGLVRIIWITSNLLLLIYTIILAVYYNCYKTKKYINEDEEFNDVFRYDGSNKTIISDSSLYTKNT